MMPEDAEEDEVLIAVVLADVEAPEEVVDVDEASELDICGLHDCHYQASAPFFDKPVWTNEMGVKI